MNTRLPLFVLLAVTAGVAFTLRTPRLGGEFDLDAFTRVPTLVNGRVKPVDTVARTSLLMLQGRQRVVAPDGRTVAPAEWLLDMFFKPLQADRYQVFEVVHPDVLAMLGLATTDGAGGKRFSLTQLQPRLMELDRQARLADDVEGAARTPFQRAVVQLRDAVILYQRLQTCAAAPGIETFLEDLARLEQNLPAAVAAVRSAPTGTAAPGGKTDAGGWSALSRAFTVMDEFGYLRLVPPAAGVAAEEGWRTIGGAWSATLASGQLEPSAQALAALGRAWQRGNAAEFNRLVRAQRERTMAAWPEMKRKTDFETRFNAAQPFYTSMALYVAAALVAFFSWLRWPEELGRIAFGLVGLAFVLTSGGILARMWLEARPPVTNLYSSALFVGWGAVALCLVLEYFFRNAVGSVAAGLIGFAALLIAHHLSLGGDTMEMMRAVLDSNFWLATHVVTITVGYSATFLAGLLAILYIVRGALTRSLDRATADALARMIYGIVCFATFFSLVGTVLGGIWADQSWGRFWGWDPKENGALLIVLWNAIILHARSGGYVRQRGLAVLAVFGNVVTAWSWFGVNMLGVGLHSYGFMGAAFWWLILFVASQLAVMLIAALPWAQWRSAQLLAAGVAGRAAAGRG
ncbi:MAG: cytochrome c biogenesis protein CcsA [Verrucomicrobia bacterium]|nr:cytochrome c biogenesis protein CcsA [Verrucomicrobiota bacterium]